MCSPFAAESLSDPGGVVVLTTPDERDPASLDPAGPDPAGRDHAGPDRTTLDRLSSLPCVVIAVDRAPGDAPALADVVAEAGVATVEHIVEAVERNPVAATALVLCLREAPTSLGRALVAESAAYSVLQAGPEFARWRAGRRVRPRRLETEAAVQIERAGDRLDLVLNRPHVRNALNGAMRDGLLEGLALAAADDSITTVVLRGVGSSFCSGGDLDEFGSFTDPASAHVIRLATSIGRSIDAVGSRLVARVHGPCAGSGVELPAFASRVVARSDFTAALPEVGLGLIPGAGGTASITRRIGRHRLALLALSGTRIDATTALRWGLVDEVSDRE